MPTYGLLVVMSDVLTEPAIRPADSSPFPKYVFFGLLTSKYHFPEDFPTFARTMANGAPKAVPVPDLAAVLSLLLNTIKLDLSEAFHFAYPDGPPPPPGAGPNRRIISQGLTTAPARTCSRACHRRRRTSRPGSVVCRRSSPPAACPCGWRICCPRRARARFRYRSARW